MSAPHDNNTRLALVEHRLQNIEQTMSDIRDALVRLAEIEARLSAVQDHERRIRSLEAGFWKSLGAFSVISVVMTMLAKKMGF